MNWPRGALEPRGGPHRNVEARLGDLDGALGVEDSSASPTSSCVLGVNGKARGVPQRRTSTFVVLVFGLAAPRDAAGSAAGPAAPRSDRRPFTSSSRT